MVNVSSPNTPGLRALQDKEPLTRILNRLQVLNKEMGKNRPILLKIAPDLTNDQLDDIISLVTDTQIQGVVATNTTIDRIQQSRQRSHSSRTYHGSWFASSRRWSHKR